METVFFFFFFNSLIWRLFSRELINVLAGRDESGDTLPKKPIFCHSLANFFNLVEMTKLSNHVGKKKLKLYSNSIQDLKSIELI
jgi:hypothetical protein